MKLSTTDKHMPINIYIDGACKGNPGPGGWGVHFENSTEHSDFYGGSKKTTNNQMEMTAALEALKYVKNHKLKDVHIHTDSNLVFKGLTEWLAGWRLRSFQNVKNLDLWLSIIDLYDELDVKFHKVKAHSGIPGNERADELANKGTPS